MTPDIQNSPPGGRATSAAAGLLALAVSALAIFTIGTFPTLALAVPPGAVATLAAAQETATDAVPFRSELAGRVVRGAGGEGVAGAPVELHRVTASGGAIVDSAVTSEGGAFAFPLADDEERPIYLVATRHEGVRYFGPALHVGLESDEPYEVAVYDTAIVAAPPEELRVGVRHVIVTRGAGGEGLDVAEVIDVIGPGDRTLVPPSDSVAMWSTALPEGARSPQPLEGGVPAEDIRFADGRAALHSMITPVGVRLNYTYGIDGDGLELPIEHPVDRIEIVVAGAEAEVDGAMHAETSTRDGRVLHRYEGASLEPGETVEIDLITSGGGDTDRWAYVWAAIGAALLLAAAAVWSSGRRTSPPRAELR